MSYRFADSLRARSGWNYPKHAQFYSKNKSEELMHLVDFITRIDFISRLCIVTMKQATFTFPTATAVVARSSTKASPSFAGAPNDIGLVPSAFWWVKKRFAFRIGDTHNIPDSNGAYLALSPVTVQLKCDGTR